MKRLIILFVVCVSFAGFSQFKDDGMPKANIKDGIVNTSPTTGFLGGLLNSENFQMKHSFGLSYSAIGNQAVSLGVYTNSMFFKLADNLNAQVDASLVNSPYSTFGQEFQNNINGFYISRAAINYKPWKDVFISVQYRNIPGGFYYDSYNRGFLGSSRISEFDNEAWFFGR